MLETIAKLEICELVPTEELVTHFETIFNHESPILNEIITAMILRCDWPMLFTLSPSFSPIPVLLKTAIFICGEEFPIHKIDALNPILTCWMEFDWSNIANDILSKIFFDFSSNLNLDSFIHPSSCHITSLNIIRAVCLNGKDNSILQDSIRRRIWIGALARMLRRCDLEAMTDELKSRISSFIEGELSWTKIGIPNDEQEEIIITIWGDLFQVLNSNAQFLPYFCNVIQEQTELTSLRLFIGTSSRIIRDPICQLVIIEAAIEKSFKMGHGLSLLHGTLSSLPVSIRNEFHECINQTESLLCPLLLLQEQLRSTLPISSKVKLVQQNTHLISNIRLTNLSSEWKLVIYLHQIIRLTMSIWKNDEIDKDSFGLLQVYVHNELKPILQNLFEQKSTSMLLSMVGYRPVIPSPSFQILVKAFTLLITNLCTGTVDTEELQKFQDLDQPGLNGIINHLCDLIQFNTIDNIDQMVRVWSTFNNNTLSIFYLDNP